MNSTTVDAMTIISVDDEQSTINPFADYLQSRKFIALVSVQRASGALSMIGSACIICSLLKNRKMLCFTRNGSPATTATMILLMISICDLLSSSSSFMGTWMVPKGIAWQASGNFATCTVQGYFFHAFAQIASFYNVMQALYYVLAVCYGVKEDTFRKPLLRFLFLVFPFVSVITYNIWPLADGAFSYSQRAVCSYEPYPLGCMKTGDCTRGSAANTIRLYNTIFIMVCAGVIICSVFKLWWFVMQKEKALDKYNVEAGENNRNRSRSNKVALQGICYAGCFLATYLLWIVFCIRKFMGLPMLYWLLMSIHFCIPLQGFLNSFVYFRQNWQEMQVMRSSIVSSVRGRLSMFTSSSMKMRKSSSAPEMSSTMTMGASTKLDSTITTSKVEAISHNECTNTESKLTDSNQKDLAYYDESTRN